MNIFTIEFKLDSKEPLYKQLYDFIIQEIKTQNLKEGEKLPSKRALANHLKISINTVETAYEMLVTEGYVQSRNRSGFYVCLLEKLDVTEKSKKQFIFEKEVKKNYKYDFKTNVVDTSTFPYSTWAKITKEIIYNSPELLQHGDRQGDYCLREVLAKYLHEFRGVNCIPEQIIMGAGMEYLMSLITEILGNSAIFAFENPGYSKIYKIIKNNERKVNPIKVDDDGMCLVDLKNTNSNIAYITPSHQFPMGAVMPIGKRIELLKWANLKDDRYIIEDDYDSEFRFNGKPIPSLQGLDENGKVIYVSTFSRSIAPSIRVAYMVLPPRLLEIYHKNFSFYSSTISRMEQHTISRFIDEGHFSRHINRMKNIYRIRKETLVDCIKKSRLNEYVKIIGANAGLHLILKVDNGMSEKELVESAERVDIRVYGLSEYCISNQKYIGDNMVVLGYSGLLPDEITQAVELLNKAWIK